MDAHTNGNCTAKASTIDYSIRKILDLLSDIREVGIVYPAAGPRKTPIFQTTLSRLSPEQQRLFETLGLERYRAP